MDGDDPRGGAILGTAFHTPEQGHLEVLKDALILVDGEGWIERVSVPWQPDYERRLRAARQQGRLSTLPTGHCLIPGLVDLHIHASQWPQLGGALDEPLEVWLQKYTFPLEAEYANVDFARRVYQDLVDTLLHHGTTTALYFATVHREASLALAEICAVRGQRALVGKVAMDDPRANPDNCRDADATRALADSRAFIEDVRALCDGDTPMVQPVITPRFIPSCTPALLSGLGRLAEETGCRIQTHCSESDWEVGYVRAEHGGTDCQVLHRHGLLREHTVLAHCNFVSDDDLRLITAQGAGVAHCPLSNLYFANAVFPLRHALEHGARVGLGTDISGGYSPFLLDSARQGIAVSRLRSSGVDPTLTPEQRGLPGDALSAREAFWLATAGGADTLGLPVGRLAEGCKFDALQIAAGSPGSGLRYWPGRTSDEQWFEKIVLNATPGDIRRTWVNGRVVAAKGES